MTDSKNVDFKAITTDLCATGELSFDLICELRRWKLQNEAVQFVINSFNCINFNTMRIF